MVLAVRPLNAGFILAFNPTNSLNFAIVPVGSNFSVDLYLLESSTSDLTTHGLLGFGTRGTFNSSLLVATGATNAVSFPISGGSPDLSVPGRIDVYGGASSPPKLATIRLATLNFLAVSPGTSSIVFRDLDPGISDFTLSNSPTFTDLDGLIFAPGGIPRFFTFTVQAVPEPSSFASVSLIVFVAAALTRSRRYRRFGIGPNPPTVVLT